MAEEQHPTQDAEKKTSKRRGRYASKPEKTTQPATSETPQRTFTGAPPSERASQTSLTTPIQYIQAQGDDSTLRIPGQTWMVLSYVAPTDTSVRSKNVMIKVSNGFANESDAEEHALKVRKQPHHHLIDSYIVPENEWLTVPMPKAAEVYCRRHYADQPVMEKLMEGNWNSSEESRRSLAKRKQTAMEQNRRRLKAMYGQDYEQPVRTTEEKAEQERLDAASHKKEEEADASSKKTMSYMDAAVLYAKFLIKKAREAKLAAAAAEGQQDATEGTPRFDIAALTPEIKQEVADFKRYIEEEMAHIEQRLKEQEASMAATQQSAGAGTSAAAAQKPLTECD